MRGFLIYLGLVFLGCSGCDKAPEATQNRSAANGSSVPAVPDRPIGNAFPDATEVRLFVNAGYKDDGKPVLSQRSGKILSTAQRSQFESLIRVHTTRPDDVMAMCFIPHHFFRYYDSQGKQVGELEVCFCCSGVASTGRSRINLANNQSLTADYEKLATFVRSLGERTDVNCD